MKKYANSIHNRYLSIADQCVITTASCRFFAPYLLNMLSSLHQNFPTHPKIYVYDLGMTHIQLQELRGINWVTVKNTPAFAPHWYYCWSWKPWIWTLPRERYILHLDSGLVVLRSLELWFLSIQKHGYISFAQGQKLQDITPPDVLEKVGLKPKEIEGQEVFAAGVFGFDRQSHFGKAVQRTAQLAKEGWALGWSPREIHRAKSQYDRIVRNCPTFRHDQTLLNLEMRRNTPYPIDVRKEKKYLGVGSPKSYPRQFVWHSRRKPSSMIYFNRCESHNWLAFFYNRAEFHLRGLKSLKSLMRGLKKIFS